MILVTGAAGFLGREIVRQLHEREEPIRAVDIVEDPTQAPRGIERMRGDLVDPAFCRSVVAGARAVIHSAAVQFHTPGCPRFRIEPFFQRNASMTRALLDAAHEAGVKRFVFVSSDMVYGPPVPPVLLREDAPTRPVGPYGRSKVVSEAHCRAARGKFEDVTVLRPSVIIGPGRLGLMKKLFDMVRTGRSVPMFGPGNNRHHMIAVDDLARASILALDKTTNGTYNIASQNPPTTRQMLSELCRRAGSSSKLVSLPTAPLQLALSLLWSVRLSPMNPEQYLIAPVDYVLDTSAAREALGFEARRHDTDTMVDTYRWYVETQAA
ncbi:MAG TPA: NAD(P)-dependent oxidoreductase [Candidatus Eisenbacteria bacterium]|nr:NAD(P)-dependent oxidoreductase [Candidatus Eisenbacteria bacterium]